MKRVERLRITLGVVLGFSALVYLFAWSPLLSVRSIYVEGLPTGVHQNSIIERAGVEMGEKLARIEPRAVTKSLQSISWIKSADISRTWWNGRVTISLTARTPVGVYQSHAVDASGVLFDYPGKLLTSLPELRAPRPDLALLGVALYKKLPQSLAQNLDSLSIHNESEIISRHIFKGGRTLAIIWGGMSDISLKVKVLEALLALPENAAVKRIDLSAPHAPIVK